MNILASIALILLAIVLLPQALRVCIGTFLIVVAGIFGLGALILTAVTTSHGWLNRHVFYRKAWKDACARRAEREARMNDFYRSIGV